ncbi:glycosyltransferase 87 family protein [Plantactinospora sp. GCM10030261]|uniref:glycosyltransferase 87 family protein n=1 Tax=Plantactinospora sp. GCM10030261 TaxID=3273420 RepID=UPI00360C61C8
MTRPRAAVVRAGLAGLDRRAAVVWGLFAVVAVVSSVLVLRRPPGDRLADLHIYYGAAETVAAGRPLYAYAAENGGPFTYPPFAVLLLGPMTAVSEPVLRVLWLTLTCAAIAAIAIAVGGRPGGRWDGGAGGARVAPRHRQLVVAVVACAVLVSAPAQSNLRFGQVSVFIVLLALVDGVGLTPARYRGVLVGIAAAVKLTPLLFVVWFLLSGRWRDAGRAVAAFVGCAALGAAVLPVDSWTYWTGTMLRTSRIGDLASLGNQSVHGMLLRAGVPPDTLPLLWAGLVAVVCGTALLRARRMWLTGQPVGAVVLVGCATVAASPVSWTHHQLWTVLAAMLMVAARGLLRRIAGGLLLLAMVVSLGALLSAVSTYPGWQFVLENARTLGVLATCLLGVGAITAVGAATGERVGAVTIDRVGAAPVGAPGGPGGGAARPSRRRVRLRVATTVAAALACVAVLPLPAAADPTFKAYDRSYLDKPRYFFYCGSRAGCPAPPPGDVVLFGTARERTKVRVNGVATAGVARLEYRSAPGGGSREIPLLEIGSGLRAFSFRSATMAHGQLTAYATDDRVLATYTDELP